MDLFTGELLALDLVNTRAATSDGEADALDDAAGFTVWLALQAHRLSPLPAMTRDDLPAVRALREHVRQALDAVRQGGTAPDAVAAINQAVRAAPPYRILAGDGTAETRRDGDALTCLLAQLAEAAVDLLSSPDVERVRACEGPHCRMLFLPAHPRRRWCSPTLCGNRVRVARHHQRRKAAERP
ncbi:CGNR zinc finger domain-containing protein [Nonomuraea sp. NPDC050328]|uniref:CGNR zinc finger domain-containing protein n=1 Tax=Nonomuraea sp. NPDC050328 TaxID=3364361 RepID=UPI00379F502C